MATRRARVSQTRRRRTPQCRRSTHRPGAHASDPLSFRAGGTSARRGSALRQAQTFATIPGKVWCTFVSATRLRAAAGGVDPRSDTDPGSATSGNVPARRGQERMARVRVRGLKYPLNGDGSSGPSRPPRSARRELRPGRYDLQTNTICTKTGTCRPISRAATRSAP